MMADPDLKKIVALNQSRIDTSILPNNFSSTYTLYVINQNSDLTSVSAQANAAAKGAYDAQVRNDEQDVTLNDYAVELADHDERITSAEDDINELQEHAIVDNPSSLQTIEGSLNVTTAYEVSGIKIVGAQQSGWIAIDGTPVKGGINADQIYNASTEYSQSDIQALATGLLEARQVIKALSDALIAHGLMRNGL